MLKLRLASGVVILFPIGSLRYEHRSNRNTNRIIQFKVMICVMAKVVFKYS